MAEELKKTNNSYGTATVVGAIIFGIVAVGTLIQIQIGNVSQDTRQANEGLRNELTANMDAMRGRLTNLEALEERIRSVEKDRTRLHERVIGANLTNRIMGVESVVTRLDQHASSHDKDLGALDDKIQVEILKLDEKLQLEIGFWETTVKRIESDLERIRQVMIRQQQTRRQLVP